jgi:hypothetical protein
MLPGRRAEQIEHTFFGYATNGGSNELGVDGSSVPVRFEVLFPTSVGRDFDIINTTLTLSGGKIDDPNGFIGLASPGLAVGMELGFITVIGDFPMKASPYKTNFDIVTGSGFSKPWGFSSSSKDMMYAEILGKYNIRITTGQVSGIYIIVNDDLESLTGRYVVRGNTY